MSEKEEDRSRRSTAFVHDAMFAVLSNRHQPLSGVGGLQILPKIMARWRENGNADFTMI
jgi:hypothetical protein